MTEQVDIRHILLIENDQIVISAFQDKLADLTEEFDLQIVSNPSSAHSYLEKKASCHRQGLPDLIIFDPECFYEHSAHPTIESLELVTKIKFMPRYRHIPIIIFTSLVTQGFVKACYRVKSNIHIPKPKTKEAIQSTIDSLLDFWLINSRLPN